MTGKNGKVLRGRVVLWLILVSLMASAARASAIEPQCTAVNEFDQPRECTITEDYGSCLYDARESWRQCLAAAGDSWWLITLCDGGAFIDILACSAELPFTIVQM